MYKAPENVGVPELSYDDADHAYIVMIAQGLFLANVNSRSRSLYAIARVRLSVCRLSVCNVGAPYSAG